MLVEGDDWRLGTLTDSSDYEYRLQHTPSGLQMPFDSVHVERQNRYKVSYTLYVDGQPIPTFEDSERLPDAINRRLMQIADE